MLRRVQVLKSKMANRTTVTVAAFARAQNVARSGVYKWARRGMPRLPDGTINLAAARRWLRQNVVRKQQHGGKVAAGVSLLQARRRRLNAEAAICEMKARAMAASLVETAACRLAWNAHVKHVRAVLLAIPAELAPQLATITGVLQCQQLLDREIRRVLEELAAYGSQKDGG